MAGPVRSGQVFDGSRAAEISRRADHAGWQTARRHGRKRAAWRRRLRPLRAVQRWRRQKRGKLLRQRARRRNPVLTDRLPQKKARLAAGLKNKLAIKPVRYLDVSWSLRSPIVTCCS